MTQNRTAVETLETIANLIAQSKQQRGLTDCPKCQERETLIECIGRIITPWATHTDVL